MQIPVLHVVHSSAPRSGLEPFTDWVERGSVLNMAMPKRCLSAYKLETELALRTTGRGRKKGCAADVVEGDLVKARMAGRARDRDGGQGPILANTETDQHLPACWASGLTHTLDAPQHLAGVV